MFRLKYILLFIILFSILHSRGQNNTITVVDFKSEETIPFAHVCFEELNNDSKYYLITNADGVANIPGNRKLVVAVSFVGYKVQVDTILPGKDYIVKLSPKVFDIDQVVVTASFVPQKVDKSIYNVKVIDRREIEMKAATNLSDIMSKVVNVKLNHDPALGTSLRIKGLSGNNVKILVDGVPVIGREGGNIDLSQLNLYNIDHIEMVEGPLSVIYGSNALAGAINIITKENEYSKLNARINTYYETVGIYNIDGGISSKVGKHSFSLSGGRNFFSGYSVEDNIKNGYLDIEDRYSEWKPKEQYNADFYYTLANSRNKIKYQSSYMREQLQSKGSLLPPQYYTAFDDWFYSTRISNRLEYTQKIGDNYTLNMLGSYSYYQRSNTTYFKDLNQLTATISKQDTTIFNAFVYRLLLGSNNMDSKLNFVSGFDLNYEIANGEKILSNSKEIGDYAFFTSFMYKITEKLSIQPGIRLAYNTQYDVPPVPSVNIKWDIFSRMILRASYARGYRAPSLKELYIYFVDINHNIQPNENLKAEYGNNFDFALRFNTEKDQKVHYSHVELGLFYNNMNNIIYLAKRQIPDFKDPIYQYINILNYNTLGGQLSFQYNYYPFFDLAFNIGETGTYSSFNSKKQSLSDYKFSPDLNVNISSQIQKIGLSVSLSYKYTGKSYLYDVDENDQINITTLANYHNMDLTLLRKFFTNRVTVSAGVKNIFNNTSIDVIGGGTGTAHTNGNSSPVGYGRIYFARISYNIFK